MKIPSLVIFLHFLILLIPLAHASVDTTLTRGDAIMLLGTDFPLPSSEISNAFYFTDVEVGTVLSHKLQTACQLELLSCSTEVFQPAAPISSPAFLKLLYGHLRFQGAHNYFAIIEDDQAWYEPYLATAKKRGLVVGDFLPTIEIKATTAKHIIEKATLLKDFHYLPPYYFPGLVDTPEQLDSIPLNTLETINHIKQEYDDLYITLLNSMRTAEGYALKVAYAYNITKVRALKMAIDVKHTYMHAHPLLFDPEYDEVMRALFIEHDIKEVVGVGYYDFRNNAPYRKTNVRNSLDNVEGLILQPGEEFNYWDVMATGGGLGDIVNGWIILGGKEVWAWGGGLCGTGTAIFRAAWFSGLEITERRPHTIYYGSLYNAADIGLDAAVYQNSPNLRFKNNTGNTIMMHVAWNATRDEAWVQVLGTKHFNSINFSGLEIEGWKYKRSRTLELLGAEPVTESIYSSYNKIK